MYNQEMHLILMKLDTSIWLGSWRSACGKLQKFRSLLFPVIRAPHTYLEIIWSQKMVSMQPGTKCSSDGFRYPMSQISKKANSSGLGKGERKNLLTWASAPDETSTFNKCENAKPVILFKWPFNLLLTCTKWEAYQPLIFDQVTFKIQTLYRCWLPRLLERYISG